MDTDEHGWARGLTLRRGGGGSQRKAGQTRILQRGHAFGKQGWQEARDRPMLFGNNTKLQPPSHEQRAAITPHRQFAVCPLFFAHSRTFCINDSRRCWFIIMVREITRSASSIDDVTTLDWGSASSQQVAGLCAPRAWPPNAG